MRRPSTLRRLGFLALLAAGAALLTIGLAWGVARWGTYSGTTANRLLRFDEDWAWYREAGGRWAIGKRAFRPEIMGGNNFEMLINTLQPPPPHGGQLGREPAQQIVRRFGIPFPCLEYDVEWFSILGGQANVVSGIMYDSTRIPRLPHGENPILPTRVRWGPFLLDWVMWMACGLGPVAGVRVVTRRRRAAVGQCIGCGYNRAGIGADAPCPECGMKLR